VFWKRFTQNLNKKTPSISFFSPTPKKGQPAIWHCFASGIGYCSSNARASTNGLFAKKQLKNEKIAKKMK